MHCWDSIILCLLHFTLEISIILEKKQSLRRKYLRHCRTVWETVKFLFSFNWKILLKKGKRKEKWINHKRTNFFALVCLTWGFLFVDRTSKKQCLQGWHSNQRSAKTLEENDWTWVAWKLYWVDKSKFWKLKSPFSEFRFEILFVLC